MRLLIFRKRSAYEYMQRATIRTAMLSVETWHLFEELRLTTAWCCSSSAASAMRHESQLSRRYDSTKATHLLHYGLRTLPVALCNGGRVQSALLQKPSQLSALLEGKGTDRKLLVLLVQKLEENLLSGSSRSPKQSHTFITQCRRSAVTTLLPAFALT